MKVAVFYNIAFSGAKRVVQEHVIGLRSLGHHVDVYTTDSAKDIFSPAEKSDNSYLYPFKPVVINLPILSRLKGDFIDTFITLRGIHKKIAKDIDQRNYDIVLVHTDISTQAPFLLRYLKTKSVYFCLEPLRNAYEYSLRFKENVIFIKNIYENINRWFRKQIDRSNTLSADHILALSLFGRERIISSYDLYPKVSYLGVNEKLFRPKKNKKKKYIFFVAEKQSIYGYDLAKKAMDLVPKKIKQKFKIISWKKNNSERLSDEELVDLYNQSILILSLSKFDTFGLVPLESMACGVPVIGLNVAGYRETIINNQTGYLVDFDSQDIANKIIYLLNNPQVIESMGKNGREWIEHKWTWELQIKNLEKLLKEFIKSKNE